MSVHRLAQNGKWYYRFQYKRQDYFKSGFRTEDDAKEAEIDRKFDVKNNSQNKQQQKEIRSFIEGATWFFENHAKPNKRSWKNDRGRIKLMVRFFGRKPLREITPEDVEALLNWLSQTAKGASGGRIKDCTRNHYLAMLKAIFNRLKRCRKYRGENPAMFVDMKKVPRARVRFLYPSEEKVLTPLAVTDSTVWPHYYVALHTGMRVSELLNMRVEDVSLPIWDIFIPHSKSSRSRHIPISEGLATFLLPLLKGKKPSDFVLPHVVRNYVSRRFRELRVQAGIDNFLFHDLRHTFAQRLLSQGESIYKVSKILGHSSVVVTEQHYGHLAMADLKGTIDKIDGVVHNVEVAKNVANPRSPHQQQLEEILVSQPIGEVA